jgi:hypothetical protein
MTEQQSAEAVADNDNLSEPAKIDALAKVRRWFCGDTTLIDEYMSDELSVDEAAELLARPIDEAYSTSSFRNGHYAEGMAARSQRKSYSSDKAPELRGPEQDVPTPKAEFDAPRSTESLLWDLWYGVLHAAKRIPYADEARQEKLLALARTLKSRPDPPPPRSMTMPLKRNWIYAPGVLWSRLLMLGPSVAEVSNDACGCGAGWLLPERHAWQNLSAFMARLTASGLLNLCSQGKVAVESATERAPTPWYRAGDAISVEDILDHNVKAASLWIIAASDWLWKGHAQVRNRRDIDVVDNIIHLRDDELPWLQSRENDGDQEDWETARREFARRRFEAESENEHISTEARELAGKAAIVMRSILQLPEAAND